MDKLRNGPYFKTDLRHLPLLCPPYRCENPRFFACTTAVAKNIVPRIRDTNAISRLINRAYRLHSWWPASGGRHVLPHQEVWPTYLPSARRKPLARRPPAADGPRHPRPARRTPATRRRRRTPPVRRTLRR